MTTEEIRHKFNRLTFYTILFTFLGVTMTFIIFTSVAQPTLTCPAGQFVNVIGTSSDSCSPPACVNNAVAFLQCGTSSLTASGQTNTQTQTFSQPFTKIPIVSIWPITAIPTSANFYLHITLLAVDPALLLSNVPATDAEIINHEIQAFGGIAASSTVNFCFFVTVPGLTAQGKVKYSVNSGVTWNDFTNLVPASLVSTGLQCGTASLTTGIGTMVIAPFTTNGAGVGDSPSVTNIDFSYLWFVTNGIIIRIRSGFVTATNFQWQVVSQVVLAGTWKIGWGATVCTSSSVVIDCPSE